MAVYSEAVGAQGIHKTNSAAALEAEEVVVGVRDTTRRESTTNKLSCRAGHIRSMTSNPKRQRRGIFMHIKKKKNQQDKNKGDE